MASMNRRTFLAAAAASTAALAARPGRAQGKTYKACVIGDTKNGGYGHSLHRMWNLRDDVAIVGLADPDEEGRAKMAAECGAAKTYADYEEMLAKEKPDFVAVGPRITPPHRDYLAACVAAGCHGIMEKPLAPDLADCDAMVDMTEAKNLKWAMAFNFRVSPVIDFAKKAILEDGVIGEVVEVRSRGKEDHRAGGEDLVVMGVHLFDMMAYFFGEPQWVWAQIQMNGKTAVPADVREGTEPLGPIVGDDIAAIVGLPGGIRGHFASVGRKDVNPLRWGMEIHGTKGIVSIRMDRVPKIHILSDPTWTPGVSGAAWQPLPGLPEPVFPDSPVGHYKPIVDAIVDAVEKGGDPICSLKDGRRAHECIQGVWQSHVNGGAPVPIPAASRSHPLASWT